MKYLTSIEVNISRANQLPVTLGSLGDQFALIIH